MSEPVKPITFFVGRDVPQRWRPYVRAGIELWRPAFEAAGFRNAIKAGLDVLASVYAARTEVGTRFDEIREKEGLGAALRWRAAQFAE